MMFFYLAHLVKYISISIAKARPEINAPIIKNIIYFSVSYNNF